MIKIFSKLVFIAMGIFHFIFNYIVFMWNWVQGKTMWIYNNNTIGEANFEAISMTLLLPFFVYGAYLYIKEFKKSLTLQLLAKEECTILEVR